MDTGQCPSRVKRYRAFPVRPAPESALVRNRPVAHASRLCNRAEEYGLQDHVNATPAPKRVPWNKGKLTGAKPPLRPKHVWSIRTKLQIEGRARLPSSIWQSTASFAAVTSSPSGLRMSLPAGA